MSASESLWYRRRTRVAAQECEALQLDLGARLLGPASRPASRQRSLGNLQLSTPPHAPSALARLRSPATDPLRAALRSDAGRRLASRGGRVTPSHRHSDPGPGGLPPRGGSAMSGRYGGPPEVLSLRPLSSQGLQASHPPRVYRP